MKKAKSKGCQWQLKGKSVCGGTVESGTVFCERHLLEARLDTARFILSSALILAKAKKHAQLAKLLEAHAAKIGKAECGGNVPQSDALKVLKAVVSSIDRNINYGNGLMVALGTYNRARKLAKVT